MILRGHSLTRAVPQIAAPIKHLRSANVCSRAATFTPAILTLGLISGRPVDTRCVANFCEHVPASIPPMKQHPDGSQRHGRLPPHRFLWLCAPIALALAALACDGDYQPPPLTSITCLRQQPDGAILALEQTASYLSLDGGLSWQQQPPLQPDPVAGCGGYYDTRWTWTLADPADPAIVYRFNPEVSIERSLDGGSTWQLDFNLSGTEARMTYYVNIRHDGVERRSGPLDALFDPRTGNLVVAMGYEGVLVRSPLGAWTWVSVGQYTHVNMLDLSIILPLISDKLQLAVLIGVTLLGSLPTLSRGMNAWLVAAAAFCSAVMSIAAAALVFQVMSAIIDALFKPSNPFAAVFIASFAVAVLTPALISWVFATRTHQEDRIAFTWSGMCWAYLGLLLVLTSMSSV